MTELGEYTSDNLIAGDMSLVTQQETVVSGQNVVRGTVMGQITASGKISIVNSANSDGTENPYCVMAEDVDASLADDVGITYQTGQFNENALVFGGADTIATHRAAMRQLNMHGMPSMDVAGTLS